MIKRCILIILVLCGMMVAFGQDNKPLPELTWTKDPEKRIWSTEIMFGRKTTVEVMLIGDIKVVFFAYRVCPNSRQTERLAWDAGDAEGALFDCFGGRGLSETPQILEPLLNSLPDEVEKARKQAIRSRSDSI